MANPTRSINLSVNPQDKQHLEQLAQSLGRTWGDKPSISQLIKAIARRELLLTPNDDWPANRLAALELARQALVDQGQIHPAQLVAELLLSRGELSLPLRQALEQFVGQPPQAWRLQLEQQILRQQPFCLAYYDAADRPFTFSIAWAEMISIERRQYLQCWCAETADNPDLPELAHNRTLRLDRIPEAAISPYKIKWRAGPDLMQVELRLYDNLALAYSSKPTDLLSQLLPSQPLRRRVVRQVSSTFWLFREILPYGEDCEIVGPPQVRQQFEQKVQALAQRYEQLNAGVEQ
jgi:predicted DNA-binding transcriptional regulator YafY